MKTFVGLWLALLPLAALAQNTQDPMAKKLLDQVSAKYKSISSYSADYVFELRNNQTKEVDRMEGQVAVKGSMYKMLAAGQEVYNNGQSVWTVLKDPDYCEVTVNDPDPDDPFNPSNILDLYKKDFKYYLAKNQEEIDGKKYDVVDLSPMNPRNDQYGFFKARLFIDPETKLLKRWIFFEKGNISRTTITINNFKTGTHDSNAAFSLNEKDKAYSDCEFINLKLD